jgi:hypothetical protein
VAHAAPRVAGRATPSATLTNWRADAPVPGRTIVFSTAGRTICSATTDATGVAACQARVAVSASEYYATFEGDPQFAAAGARGALTAAPASRCTSPRKRTLRVRRGKPGKDSGLRVRNSLRGARIVKAELRDGSHKPVRRLKRRGMRVTVDLTGLDVGTYTVRVTIRLKSGRRVSASRKVTAC